MFSVITNIYSKKTKASILMGFFTATGKLEKFFWLEMFDGCTTFFTALGTYHCSSEEYWHPCWRVCGKNLNIVSMCAVSPVVRTSNVSICQKNLHFSCGCEQFH
jgi:hypothetical protein